ncbi:reverse transcriptase [Tanacetum coccineum]
MDSPILVLTLKTWWVEIGESSAAAQELRDMPGPSIETRLLDTERDYDHLRVCRLRRSPTRACLPEQEGMETRQALARSEAHCRALEARVTVLETEARRHEWQRQAADDLAVQYIMRTQALEAGARVDTLEDTENGTKKSHKVNDGPQQQRQLPTKATKTTYGHKCPTPSYDCQGCQCPCSPEGAVLDATRNGTNSHSSGTGVSGSERVTRECTYQDFISANLCISKEHRGSGTLSERQAENKRKLNNTSKNNQNQQQPNKRQNTGKAYAAGHGEKKYYGGSKPLCPKCNYHHDGPCPPKCHRCNIVGHLVRNCRRPTNDNTTNNQRGTGTSQKVNCYECGNQGHYKRDCPERKNQSHKNQIGGTRAHGVVHTLRGEETDQDPNNIKDEIKA